MENKVNEVKMDSMPMRFLKTVVAVAMVLGLSPILTVLPVRSAYAETTIVEVADATALATAIAAGNSVKLIGDIDLGTTKDSGVVAFQDSWYGDRKASVIVPASANITLNMNGHTLSANGSGDHYMFYVPSGSSLTVTGAGTLDYSASSMDGHLFRYDGTVTIDENASNLIVKIGYTYGQGNGTIAFKSGKYNKDSLNSYYGPCYYDKDNYYVAQEDSYYVIKALSVICTVNDVEYKTISAAMSAAKVDNVITFPIVLTADATYSNSISEDYTFNGDYTLTVSGSISKGTYGCDVVSSSTISGGTFAGDVTSSSYITGGTFNGSVTSTGIISGGTFANAITGKNFSDGTYDVAVTASGTISGGTYNATTTAASITGGTFTASASATSISGGTFTSTASATSVSGGVFASVPETIAENYAYAVNSGATQYMIASSANIDSSSHKVINGAYAKYYGVSDFVASGYTTLTANSYNDYVVNVSDVNGDGKLYKGVYNFYMYSVFADGYTSAYVKDANDAYAYIVGQNIQTDSYKITAGTFLNDPTPYVNTSSYDVSQNSGTYTVSLKDSEVVATITETGAKYPSLTKAFDAVKEGQTVVLNKDTEENATFYSYNGMNVTFDLNGHILSSSSGITLNATDNSTSKVFTICDSQGGGKIVAADGTAVQSGNSSYYAGANLKIESGTFEGTTAVKAYSNYYSSFVTIAGGTFTGAMAKGTYGYYTINAGTFSVDPSTISGVTINGDTTYNETANTYTVTPVYYTITVSASNHGTALVNGESSVTVLKNTVVTLTGTPDDGYRLVSYKNGDTTLSTASSYSFKVTADATITPEFGLKPYKNTTTNTVYETLAAAVSAASAGDTIQMQADDELSSNIELNGNDVILDLNGFTISGEYEYTYNEKTYHSQYQITANNNLTIISSVDGGTLKSSVRAVKTLTINSGSFGTVYAGSTTFVLNINGGSQIADNWINAAYNGNHYPVNITDGIVQSIQNAVLNISGGYVGDISANSTGSISGGQFKDNVSSFVASGYVCEAIPDGITKLNDDAAYRVTLNTADKPDFVKFAESAEEQTFTLTENLDLTSYQGKFELVGTKTINLNGHTLTLNRGALIVDGNLTVNNGEAETQGSIVDPSDEEVAFVERELGATLTVNGSLAVTGNVRIYGRTLAIKVAAGSTLNLNGTTVNSDYSGAIIASGGTAATTITIQNATISSESSSVVNNGTNWSYTIRANGKNITLNLTDTTVTGVHGAVSIAGENSVATVTNCDLSTHNTTGNTDAHAAMYASNKAVANVYDTKMFSPRTNYAAYSGNSDVYAYYGTINLYSGCLLSDKGYAQETSSVIAPANSLSYAVTSKADQDNGYNWAVCTPVASITKDNVTTEYASLQAAIDAAVDGDTIKVLTDIDLDDHITISKGADIAITLDLNGYTISRTDNIAGASNILDVNSDLTITDNSADKDGKIIYTKTCETSIWDDVNMIAVNDGDFVVEEGTFVFTTTGCFCYASYVIDLSNNSCNNCGHASVTINGGNFSSTNGDAVIRVHDQDNRSYEITLTINDGTFTGGAGDAVVWLDVQGTNGGTNTSVVNVNLNGGTFTAASNQRVLDFGSSTGSDSTGINVAITGGKYLSNATELFRVRSITEANIGKIVFSGGVFNKTGVLHVNGKTGAALSGGTALSDYVATGKEVVDNTDASTMETYPYTIGAVAVYVAQIGDTKYTTLQAALDASEAGNTVKLLADTTESVLVRPGKSVTLDMNGFTLTESNDNTLSSYTIDNQGTLVITGNGKFKDADDGDNSSLIRNLGTLTIQNGTFTSEYGCNVVKNDSYENNIDGQQVVNSYLIINGGTFNQSTSNAKYSVILNWTDTKINGGTFVGNNLEGSTAILSAVYGDTVLGALTITAGTFTNFDKVVYLNGSYGSCGTATISGGKFAGTIGKSDDSGSILISDGFFTSSSGACYVESGKTLVNTPASAERNEGYLYTVGQQETYKYIVQTYGNECLCQGGGTYQDGAYATVNVEPKSGYTFVGWYKTTDGTTATGDNLCSDLSYSFSVKSSMADADGYIKLIPVFELDSKVTSVVLTVNGGKATYSTNYEKSGDISKGGQSSIKFGSKVTLTATDEGDFIGWYDSNNNKVSGAEDYTFILDANTALTAKYAAPGEAQAVVSYKTEIKDPSGSVITNTYLSAKEYSTIDGAANNVSKAAEEQPVVPSYLGYTFTGYTITVVTDGQTEARQVATVNGKVSTSALAAAIQDADSKSTVTVTADYTKDERTFKVRLHFTDGVDDLATAKVLNTEYTYGDAIKVWAGSEDTFGGTHYVLTSYTYLGNTYTGVDTITIRPIAYPVSGYVDVYANYDIVGSSSTITKKAFAFVEGASAITANGTPKTKIVMNYSVPDEWNVTAVGFVMSTTETEPDTANYTAKASSAKLVGKNTGTYTININQTNYIDVTNQSADTIYARGYVTYEYNDGDVVKTNTIYTSYNDGFNDFNWASLGGDFSKVSTN